MVGTDQPVLSLVQQRCAGHAEACWRGCGLPSDRLGHGGAAPCLTKPPADGGWNLFCTGFSGLDFFSPASDLPLRGNGKGAWFGWPDDPKIEALREAWFNAPDLALRGRSAPRFSYRRSKTSRTFPSGWRKMRRHSARTLPACQKASSSSGTSAVPDCAVVVFGAAVRLGGRPSTTLVLSSRGRCRIRLRACRSAACHNRRSGADHE